MISDFLERSSRMRPQNLSGLRLAGSNDIAVADCWSMSGRSGWPMQPEREKDPFWIGNYSIWFNPKIPLPTVKFPVTGHGAQRRATLPAVSLPAAMVCALI